MLSIPPKRKKPSEYLVPRLSHVRAWLPLALQMGLIILELTDKAKFLSPSIALLIGAMVCLALARDKMQDIVHTASRREGVIVLDLCETGAFGYVIAQSGLGNEIYSRGHFLPVLLLPFLASSVLQLAQGSRVVTVVVAAQIL